MKKYTLILAIGVVMTLTACGSGSTAPEATDSTAAQVDSAAVMVNASTRFTDGGEFGFGAEMGISNQKLHARGPMGLLEMTSTKYVVKGQGHIRGKVGEIK
mgnify:CR=1 FL=1